MSYIFYKFTHLFGIFLILLSLGAIFSHRIQGGSKADFKQRKFFGAVHGIGLLIAFIAGFGLMARAGYSFSTAGWIHGKLVVWLLLGMYPMVFYKQKTPSKLPYFGLLAVLFAALYLVEYKPF